MSGIGLDLEDQRLARGSVENPEFNSKVPFHYLSRQVPQLTLSTEEGRGIWLLFILCLGFNKAQFHFFLK